MATREELKSSVTSTISQFEHILTLAGIKKSQIVNYLMLFDTHAQHKMLNTFINGDSKTEVAFTDKSLFKLLARADVIFRKINEFAPIEKQAEDWVRMRLMHPSHTLNKQMQTLLFDIRTRWTNRPKPSKPKKKPEREVVND